jgi:hypothetical protein
MATAGLALVQLWDTSSELSKREPAFRAQAHSALLLDEKLCDTILRAGAKTGATALFMAYFMMLASVAPTAMVEIKSLRRSDDDDLVG